MDATLARWTLVEDIATRLAAAGVPAPEVDARLLVEDVAARFGGALAGCDAGVLDALVERRCAREPLQLLLGHTWFRYLRLECAAGVFIPRPETEVVAEAAIAAARAAGPRPVVVEPCTGTGAIALSVAAEVAGAQVLATDISPAAVTLARRNLAALVAGQAAAGGPGDPGAGPAAGAEVEIVVGDLLEAVPAALRGAVDVLVANPPYLPAADAATWAPEVADHDPHAALVGGPDGHEIVDRLLRSAPTWLRPGGTVVVEIDDRRGADACRAAEAAGLRAVRLVRDLTGRDRAVEARR